MKKTFLILITILLVACSKDSDGNTDTTNDDTNNDNTTEVTITVSDFSITIDENPVNGQVIGTINASTNQGSLTFSITEESPAGAFSINSSSGELKVADASLFDYEVTPTISATVKVVNGNENKTASIQIILNDVVESIYYGDVTLLTQEEIQEFGKMNYSEITGSLNIGDNTGGNTSIVDLTPLSTLEKIGGYFLITGVDLLKNLNGLDNITSIGGEVYISNNNSLQSIESLFNTPNMEIIILDLSYNPSLSSLSGVQNISTIDNLRLVSNYSLTNLDSFSNLQLINNEILLHNNSNLIDLSGLSNAKGNLNKLDIRNSPLTNLNGLENFSTNQSSSVILSGDSLSDLSALNHLTSVYELVIFDTNNLSNLDSFLNLLDIDKLHLSNNVALENMNGLKNLSNDFLRFLKISNNSILQEIYLPNNITRVIGHVIIENNSLLSNLDSFENINEIEHLTITGNEFLSDFCGLQPLLLSNGLWKYTVESNLYNPTEQDIIDGNCSL